MSKEPAAVEKQGARPRALLGAVCCLLALYATVSWFAVRGKVATADEPAHLAASIVQVRHFDFRVDREHPPLWKYWAGLPHLLWPPVTITDGNQWNMMPGTPGLQFVWATELLYRTPGNDADLILARSRAMMLVIGVALGGLIAWWAWRLGGAAAAIVAAALFSADPNFLAHGPLVKNDVAFTFAWTAFAYALWRLSRGLTGTGIFAVAVVCALTTSVKFSGLLALPLTAVVLLIRALLPMRWETRDRGPESSAKRIGLSVGILVTFALVTFLFTWAGYGFRYWMTPKYHQPLNWNELAYRASKIQAYKQHPGEPLTHELIQATDPGPFVTTLREWSKLHLVPEAWANGLLFTYVSAYFRRSYLLGSFSETGWWYYFPFAMLVKTPIATLAALVAAGIIGSWLCWMKRREGADGLRWVFVCDLACLLMPACLFLAVAMLGNLSIGVRHAFPVYPFLFIGIGWIAARAVQQWRRRAVVLIALLLTAVAVESALAYPNYISFFNVSAGADPRTRLHLLGDSNLDWGQDLKLLKRWRDGHPDGTLYCAYFGFADPAYYGIELVPLPGTSLAAKPVPLEKVRGPGYLATSATALQGLSIPPNEPNPYVELRERDPDWVLGGTIYIYRLGDYPGAGNAPPPS